MFNYCVNCNARFWSDGAELCVRCASACGADNLSVELQDDEHEALRERAQIEAERES